MPGEHDPKSRQPDSPTFVSRGGLKLHHALGAFELDVAGKRCADLGASTGGFTDCLLQAGAAHVVCIDTAYGILAYKLRIDERVTVIERANALHAFPPSDMERVDLVVIDLGWTPQRLAIPAALRWLRPAPSARIITLIKPHYEAGKMEGVAPPESGVLDEAEAKLVVEEVLKRLPALGVETLGVTRSPVVGGKAKKGRSKGNPEWLALLAPART